MKIDDGDAGWRGVPARKFVVFTAFKGGNKPAIFRHEHLYGAQAQWEAHVLASDR
jgi:hypothetical protein